MNFCQTVIGNFMDREKFKEISSQLTKGSKVNVELTVPAISLPMRFTASIKDRGPSYIEFGIKGRRGLHRLLFTQIEKMEIEDNAKTVDV